MRTGPGAGFRHEHNTAQRTYTRPRRPEGHQRLVGKRRRYPARRSRGAECAYQLNQDTPAGVASPSNSADNENLESVAAASKTGALAVGHGKTGSLILHWTGTKWTTLPNP
jgi:hypothetical protein